MTPSSPAKAGWRPWAGLLLWAVVAIGLYARNYPESPSLVALAPIALLGIVLAFQSFQGFMFMAVALTPLSIGFTDVGGGVGIALPDEVMLVLVGVGLLVFLSWGKLRVRPLLQHPLGIAILLQQTWALVSLMSSEHPLISGKFLVSKLLYILVFFIGFGNLFLEPGNIVRFFRSYLWGFVPVMAWSIFQLSQYGLSRSFSPVMAEPFYDDHTVLGACLAMVMPWAGYLVLRGRMPLGQGGRSDLAWPVLLLVLAALLLSFSRAAWMSVLVILAYWLLLRLRLRFRYIVLALVVVAAGAWMGRDSLVARFEANENVSGEDIVSTAASVTNVSTDDSNRERVNRWACAIRMFEERPVLGFGPGTYERCYGDYQVLSQITRISTFEGDRGDAHSEYLGALAEQGLPGLAFLILLFLTSLHVGMRVAYRSPDPARRALATAVLLGLSTYYFHGFVNDFIDLDKAAVLIWGMLGMLAALDLRDSGLEPIGLTLRDIGHKPPDP